MLISFRLGQTKFFFIKYLNSFYWLYSAMRIVKSYLCCL